MMSLEEFAAALAARGSDPNTVIIPKVRVEFAMWGQRRVLYEGNAVEALMRVPSFLHLTWASDPETAEYVATARFRWWHPLTYWHLACEVVGRLVRR